MLCASTAAAYGESDANGNQTTNYSSSTSAENANQANVLPTSSSSLDVAKLLTDLTLHASQDIAALGSSSDTDDDELDDDNDDACSSSAESTSCSENSFEMSSAASFTSTLNKSDSMKSPEPVISSPDVEVDDSAVDSDTAPSADVIDAVQQLSVAVAQSAMNGNGGGNGTTSSGSSGICELSEASDSVASLERSTRPTSLVGKMAVGRGPTASTSMDSFLLQKPLSPRAREQISQELSQLDTGLPTLDFESLEEKLSTAAREHEASERRKLGDEVRRRLALQYDQYTSGPSPAVSHHPARSNLAARYHASKNLQVCYLNDLSEDEDSGLNRKDEFLDSDEDDDDDDLLPSGSTVVPKSKSTPNLCRRRGMNATELARRTQPDAVGFQDRLTILREETQIMLRKAKEAAKLQMEVDRQANPAIEKVMQKKWTRLELARMKTNELAHILHGLRFNIDASNAELVQLLVEKDGLWMEQDSILVDIEDAIQHRMSSESLNLPSFLYVADPQTSKPPPASAPTTSRAPPQSNSISSQLSATSSIFAPSRWKLFKR
uniref:SCHIP-1 domain-containing protein n=1 Tax=Panagrellus redivivus TaxID=6233 RepID=A0A7E4VIN5_PANRE